MQSAEETYECSFLYIIQTSDNLVLAVVRERLESEYVLVGLKSLK